ncbi:MAG TPA: hypothetical protein VNV25_02350 [Gemmatimonadaceae bacterium]|nr:hypothetical protein [Gemmatimonadaceae bacterium]
MPPDTDTWGIAITLVNIVAIASPANDRIIVNALHLTASKKRWRRR